MDKLKKSEKRAGQMDAAGKTAASDSALKRLSAKIIELKTQGTLLDQDETMELINLYAESAVELKENASTVKKEDRKAAFYSRMLRKFSKDYTALHKYKNKLAKDTNPKYKNIDEFFDSSRTRIIRLPETEFSELDKSGAGQSIRYRVNVSIEDEPLEDSSKGDIFTGYFTEDIRNNYSKKFKQSNSKEVNNYLISEDAHNAIINYLSQKYPGAKDYINERLTQKADVYAFAVDKDYASYLRQKSSDLICGFGVPQGKTILKQNYMRSKLATQNGLDTINSIDNVEKYFAYIEYTKLYMKHILAEHINTNNLIDQKRAHGQRNALTSAVAEVLGCSDIVAFAEKMKVEALENGKKVIKKGVLMMPAKGCDQTTADCSSPFVGMNEFSTEGQASLIKSAGTLQLLDYIIGNTDRHGANFFYQFDKMGRLIGVQGIDNDTTFGSKENLEDVNAAVAFENFRLIPKTMADAVRDLKPQVLDLLLQGYDLSEEEIKNTVTRFKNLKVKLEECEKAYEGTEPGFLDPKIPRIVPDDEMNQYSFNEQLVFNHPKKSSKNNIFGKIAKRTSKYNNGITLALTNDTNKCFDIMADLCIARMEKGPGSLYREYRLFKKQAMSTEDLSSKSEGSPKKLIESVSGLFSTRYDQIELIKTYRGPGGIVLIDKSAGFDEYKNKLENALDASNAYTEALIKAEKELNRLEKTEEVKMYKYAVRIRDKVTEHLSKMLKVEDTIKDMEKGKRIYRVTEKNKESMMVEYKYSSLRANTLKRIAVLNSRNSINIPDNHSFF